MMLQIGARVVRRRRVNRTTVAGVEPAMRFLLLAAGLACGLVVGMLALPVSAVAGETCQGEAATVVGSPEVMTLLGTDGDDVIVTNGSWVGGNDVLRLSFDPGDVRKTIAPSMMR